MSEIEVDGQMLVLLLGAVVGKFGGTVVLKQRDLRHVDGRQFSVQQLSGGRMKIKVSPATVGDRA